MKIETIIKKSVTQWLPRRALDSHKGDHGHLLIVAGSRGMSGAAILAAQGALRGGAGLVTVATARSQQPTVAAAVPEVLTLGLSETSLGTVSLKAFHELEELIHHRRITAAVLGPGLGAHHDTAAFCEQWMRCFELPLVLDADGLNAMAGKIERLAAYPGPLVVTPHPGEMGRLVKKNIAAVQGRRSLTAQEFALAIRGVCVLKGHGTVVTDGRLVAVNSTGNPSMATGGMGDVLSGLLGALLASWSAALKGQSISKNSFQDILYGCSQLAVWAHGRSGDLAVRDIPHGLKAGDLIHYLPRVWKKP